MKVSIRWLKNYVDIDKTPEQLADDLSLFGHEVESVDKIGDDYILDLEITPNRGDCLSILGIAREIAVRYNLKLKRQNLKVDLKTQNLDKDIKVKIEKPEICLRFTARIIDNIRIGVSPKKIQEKLATYGFRPINNIVDITNYVMVATGQPLHAFDWDKIKDGLMRIRQAEKGEEVITLDGQNRFLNQGAIIIEDEDKIYDLAGIMGGIKSEVAEKTKTIILQGAIFDPVLIRKTSKFLNHTTDASYRYERGVDFEGTITGVDMAASLIKGSCPEAKIGQLIDIKSQSPEPRKIEIDINRINRLLGIDITIAAALDYLQRLGFETKGSLVTVPSYRSFDVKIWQDLAEEIARVYGYNKITKSPMAQSQSSKPNNEFDRREYVKDILKDLGFTETYSYSFAPKDKIELLGRKIQDCLEIANPLSGETQFLRPTLVSSLLSTIAKNPWAPEVNIFEIGKVFDKGREIWQIGMAVVGKDDQLILVAKEKLGLKEETASIDQKILDAYKIRRPVKMLISDLTAVGALERGYCEEISDKKYKKISNFAPTVRDLAFVVGENIKAEEIVNEIGAIDDKILLAELFDEFSFKNGTKNLAFHIWLQDMAGPMKNGDVEVIIKKIITRVEEKYQGKLRSK